MTQPGDLVLEFGCSGGGYIREVLGIDRRIVALNPNPVALLWAHLDLTPVPISEVKGAFTHLGDMAKGDQPLSTYMRRRYTSRCPLCGSMSTVEWYAWDRDAGHPFEKRVHCAACNAVHEGPVDEEDLAHCGSFPVESGPAYHLALLRAAPPDDPHRARIARLVQLYTERNLGLLMDLLHRLRGLQASQEVRRVITGLVLDALDRGSSLSPYEEPEARPRTLRVPQRFLERNVWMLLEQALEHYATTAPGIFADLAGSAVLRAPVASLPQLMEHTDNRHLLLTRPVSALNVPEVAGAVKMVIHQIQPPDATLWALAALWSKWLWGDDAPATLQNFLYRRRFDWDWYERNLRSGLLQVRPLLDRDAMLLMTTTLPSSAPVRAAVRAATAAGFELEQWIAAAPHGYRLVLKPRKLSPGVSAGPADAAEETASRDDLIERAIETCGEVLRQRGEPMRRQQLETACALKAPTQSLPDLREVETPELIKMDGGYLWLAAPAGANRPLADRVEHHILRLLQSEDITSEDALIAAVYRTFTGALSPEPQLIQAYIEAYATVAPDGTLVLRPEHEPVQRRNRAQRTRALIKRVGEALGYQVAQRRQGDIAWTEEKRRTYLLRCATTAYLGPHLLGQQPPSEGWRLLVLADSHVALVQAKLARDPRLQALATHYHWVILGSAKIAEMFEDVARGNVTRSEIAAYLGLEPFEEETVQMSLPLE